MKKMPDILNRWGQAPRSKATLLSDLERQAGPRDDRDVVPALAHTQIRAESTARYRSNGRVRGAARAVEKGHRIQARHAVHVDKAKSRLDHPEEAARSREVTLMWQRSTKIGHLRPWIPSAIVVILVIVMLCNDPIFMFLAVRHALDVETSLPLWDLRDPRNIVAVATAAAVSGGLVAFTFTAGRALASILFVNSRQKISREDEELRRMDARLGLLRRMFIFVLSLAAVAFLISVLHRFAAARFGDSAFSTASEANKGIVLLITALPVLILIAETFAAIPAFEHSRKVQRWATAFKARERWSKNRETRLLRRWRKAYVRAERSIDNLDDVLRDAGFRADAEIVDATISGGDAQLRNLITNAVATEIPEVLKSNKQTMDFSVAGQYLASQRSTSARSETILRSWNELQAPPVTPELATAWQKFYLAATDVEFSSDESSLLPENTAAEKAGLNEGPS